MRYSELHSFHGTANSLLAFKRSKFTEHEVQYPQRYLGPSSLNHQDSLWHRTECSMQQYYKLVFLKAKQI